MEEDYLELLELQTLIREGIEEALPGPVRVRAEIANLQRRSNGHCYLELCESGPRGPVAKVKAIIWRSSWGPIEAKFKQACGETLHDGLSLVFEVIVNYSELYGLSLVIEDIDVAHTVGEAELARQKTIARLTEEGLMDLQKELALPDIPYRIAVVSAPDAAGYGDFCRHLQENAYGFAFSITLFEATMQGDGAPASIASALDRAASAQPAFDAVLILRGGGSNLDLACFDNYDLCAAIAQCPVPVYTAIGHDRDVHIADMVACGSVKTPTALADLLIDAVAAEDERLGSLGARLRIALSGKISAMEASCERLLHRVALAFSGKLIVADARL
ncbi:MAG: exodeoxyribonuclease VII large subunit, partial [Bacteroidales bacterium]|nr:exodeoxyribonuclease VII large subunit [Bacteroidales bacterium]